VLHATACVPLARSRSVSAGSTASPRQAVAIGARSQLTLNFHLEWWWQMMLKSAVIKAQVELKRKLAKFWPSSKAINFFLTFLCPCHQGHLILLQRYEIISP
jgi:hypothetical protein